MLTEQQKKFLNSDGLVTLKACPGSGKTHVVAEKIKKIINDWRKAHCGIAALSFTNVASSEILQKVNNGFPLPYPHYVGTLDAFLNEYIALPFGHLVLETRKRPTIDVGFSRNILVRWRGECHKQCCNSLDKFHYKWDDGRLYLMHGKESITCVRKVVNGISYMLPCEDYKYRLWQKGIMNQQDIPAVSLAILDKFPDIAKALSARFPILILDEAQDTSEEQMQVIDRLISSGVNKCFLVGDSDQAIYDWRNASSKSFVDKCVDPLWIPLNLNLNFRSSQLICDAIFRFSHSQSEMVAGGFEKDCSIKPLLILYDKVGTSYEKLKEIFKKKCVENGIALSKEKVAVLTRKNHRKEINNLWKSTVFKNFADAAIDFSLGRRTRAIEKCQKAMFEMIYGSLDQLNDLEILEIRQQQFSDKKWLELTGEFISIFPDVNLGLQDWFAILIERLEILLSRNSIEKRNECDFSLNSIIKTRDTFFSDFKQWPLIDFYYQSSITDDCLESTVHGVKGCTFDATMLVVESLSGITLTTALITKGDLNDENMRIAYVAMSRPKKFLCIALPKTKKQIDLARFPSTTWEIMDL